MESDDLREKLALVNEFLAKASSAKHPGRTADWNTLAMRSMADIVGAIAPHEPSSAGDNPAGRLMTEKLETFGLSNRTMNSLGRGNVFCIYDLVLETSSSLMAMKGFGAGCLSEVEALLDKLSLSLGMESKDVDL